MIDTSKELNTGILTEQFIPDHVFVYVAKGTIHCYDEKKSYTFKSGEYCLARKNRLARYTIENTKDGFDPVIICLEEAFFKNFQVKHKLESGGFKSTDTFIKVRKTALLENYIRSLNLITKALCN